MHICEFEEMFVCFNSHLSSKVDRLNLSHWNICLLFPAGLFEVLGGLGAFLVVLDFFND
jgi:hypothetical protein